MASKKEQIIEKIKYLGLNKGKLPDTIKKFKPLEFTIQKNYDETTYKQYRYIPINEIQILLTPTNRLDDIREKYKNAAPLICYLDSKSPANQDKCSMFLNILNDANIEKIEEIGKEQENLNKRLTFKLSYKNDYLWQIYYSTKTNRYFMLYPTNDNESQALLYLVKKQIEGSKEKIFVPVINLDYTGLYLPQQELKDTENYLKLITGFYPQIYELRDKNDHLHIEIYGQTKLIDNITSKYRIILSTKEQAIAFFKTLKALFIIQSKFPNYFKFTTNINKQGSLDFYLDDLEINNESIAKFVNSQYKLGIYKIREIVKNIKEFSEKLEQHKFEVAEMEAEFLDKEKQISTFLECKKTFFGKVKYYFKHSKQKNVKKETKSEVKHVTQEIEIEEKTKVNYTIEDLLELYKQIEKYENELKNILLDLNALKLKRKNMKNKIANAKIFIEEIEKHKKSIFEFWKYSNKDEVDKLSQAEVEKVEDMKTISTTFDLEHDLEKMGSSLDKYQRAVFTDEIFNSLYLTTTPVLEILNKLKTKQLTNQELEQSLEKLKNDLVESKKLQNEEYDIFGGYENDNTKVEQLGNKKIRENAKDVFNILNIHTGMKKSEFLANLDLVIANINFALDKIKSTQDLTVYKAFSQGNLNENFINLFDLDSEKEIEQNYTEESFKMILYKFNLKMKTDIIALTNACFYNNDNNTLALGMDKSTKIIFDLSKYNLKEVSKKLIRQVQIEDEKDDFSKISIKSITLKEYDVGAKKDVKVDYQEKLRQAKENLKKYKDNISEIKKDDFEKEKLEEIDISDLDIFNNFAEEETEGKENKKENKQEQAKDKKEIKQMIEKELEETKKEKVEEQETEEVKVEEAEEKPLALNVENEEESLDFNNDFVLDLFTDELEEKENKDNAEKTEETEETEEKEDKQVEESKEPSEEQSLVEQFQDILDFNGEGKEEVVEEQKDEENEETQTNEQPLNGHISEDILNIKIERPKRGRKKKTETQEEAKEEVKEEVKETTKKTTKKTTTKKTAETKKAKAKVEEKKEEKTEEKKPKTTSKKAKEKKETKKEDKKEQETKKANEAIQKKLDIPVRENLPKSQKRSRKKVNT